ncbi:exportin-2 [Magnolia sinica]|uniref:exportin-2 n=1 Tax=Magnolia sinica TaxID=86752 RepID=UPI0026581B98|nr:exportin-2 [Magnolia sinica]
MDWSPEALELLSQCFLQTLSPNPEPRRRAEAHLSESSDRPGFALAVLRIISLPSVDDQIRQAAAVNFKNHLRSRWAPPHPDQSSSSTIPEPEKTEIKTHIVRLMLASSPRIQSQLSEALAIIGKHDFPKSWPSLLPELVSSLRQATDYASINGILSTANSIFKKFRYQYKTNDLLLDLKYCLDGFAAPLLESFLKTAALIPTNLHSADALRPLIESQRLCCRIFYSLNFQELPEFFEDHMGEWMAEFKNYLTATYPTLESDARGDGVTIVDGLRSAVCENISLYMEKNEEEFKDYLKDFASAVWTLLMVVSASSARERLTITAIKFLTTVSTSVHHALFGGADILQQICQSIVIPNIRLREEDEELFEMNYVEYIRRDIEGSDLDTRRRIACELLKGIATNYKEQVMAMVSVQIQNMLGLYSANPVENWKEKDCAIYLVVSLATKKAGGSSVSTDLVNVESFFTTVIVPELQSQDTNGFPMLKADALKFFTTFRNQISKPVAVALIPHVIRFLGSESNVVHSYAANCIEKLLLVKDEGRPRYTSLDINPLVPILMTNLFNALKFPESQENPYVMKCIMRVFGVADIGGEVAGVCIMSLTAVLSEICKNPKNPVFNHYLFEAVAALVRRSCEKDPSLIPAFEARLFPVLETILANDVSEFWPYTFQIFAQLVELNRPPLSSSYIQLFKLLLSPNTWKRSGSVPALVRLLQAYLRKAPHELNNEGSLTQVLGIFGLLVKASSTDELGFYVLNTVIENLRYDVIMPYVRDIWSTLFTRLQNHRTVKFIKSLVIFMSLFLVKHGHETLVNSINAVQPELFGMILQQFWVPNLKLITGAIEMKLTSVASTKLICESPSLLDDAAAMLWGKMLDSIVTLLARPEQDRVDDEPEVPDIGETVSYTATFVHLYNAGKKEEDPVKEIKDPREFLVTSLARLSASSPRKYPAIIQQSLDPTNQAALLQLCGTYNCFIV